MPAKLRMIRGEKLNLHGKRSIWGSCKALELECRDEDFRQKGLFFRTCSWNTNASMVWAWMLWSPYALGTRTVLWFGHGCSGQRMLSQNMILQRTQAEERKCLKIHGQICAVDPNGIMGMCPASPGTCRTRSKTPSIPFTSLYRNSLYNPLLNLFQGV